MKESENKIKAILVGCGFMGSMHAQVYSALPTVELVGAVDGRADQAKEKLEGLGHSIPVFPDLASALSSVECDYVDVCLPTDLHKKYALEVIAHGKSLFCEKPLALNLEDADEILRAAEAKGTFAQVGHCIRFWPEYQRLAEFYNNNEGGQLLSLSLIRRSGRPAYGIGNWLNNEERSGGAALDLHIHDTDFVLSLLGKPNRLDSTVTKDFSGPSHIFTLMEYDSVMVTSEGGWNYPEKWGFQMAFEAIFEQGVLNYDSSNGKGLTLTKGDKEPTELTVKSANAGQSATGEGNISDLGGYYNELEYFASCLLKNEAPQIATLTDARESLALTLEEIRSGTQK